MLRTVFVAAVVVTGGFQLVEVFAERFACDRHHVEIEHGSDLFHDAGHTACVIEELRWIPAGGTYIEQVVRVAVHPVKDLRVELYAELSCYSWDMQQGIGGSRYCAVYHYCVLEGSHRHDIPRLESHPCKLHGLLAGLERCCFEI